MTLTALFLSCGHDLLCDFSNLRKSLLLLTPTCRFSASCLHFPPLSAVQISKIKIILYSSYTKLSIKIFAAGSRLLGYSWS